jgi:hypothetical protein
MKKDLINFLFGESQVDDEIAALVEDIADMDTEGASTLKVDKAPLSKIVNEIGIEGGSLEADPRGLSMSFSDGDLFRAAHALLNEPDAMHKLAAAGWVYSLQGDVAQSNEPADFRIRFLEIDEIEPENMKANPNAGHSARVKKVADIMKKGREFATTKPDHDEHSPVDYDDKSDLSAGQKGVGKAKDGAQPEGKPKGATKESVEEEWKCSCGSKDSYVRGGVWKCSWCDKEIGPKMPKDESVIGEGKHKSGCQCGFCKNKGSFGKSRPKDDDSGPDWGGDPTSSDDLKGESLTPESVVNRMLEGNPGTQPGILGTKSFSSMKVPSSHKDRKFTPAPGMVQPDNEIVNKQSKRKVNDGK